MTLSQQNLKSTTEQTGATLFHRPPTLRQAPRFLTAVYTQAFASERVSTTLSDLAVLCPNCHRAIHRTKPLMSVEEFRSHFQAGRASHEAALSRNPAIRNRQHGGFC